MDQDVKLSMDQAHEKWITKTITLGILGALGILTLGAYSCERSSDATQVQKAQVAAQQAHDDAMKAMWEKQKPAESK